MSTPGAATEARARGRRDILAAMRQRKRWLLVPLGAMVALGLGGLGLSRGWWRVNYPDPERFPVRGIDVSHHQGPIDWPTVASEPHLAFAYVKATEGGDWTDPRFAENWREARRAGLRVGAYHFFTFCRPPLDQARHFLSVLPRDAGTLPPAVDLEFGGNCSRTPEQHALRRDLAVWLQAVEQATGSRPVIYVTREAYDAFLDGGDVDHPIWIRDIWAEPRLPNGVRWALWQFANRGRVRGIDTVVDLNVFAGSPEAFGQF
jgi:lysozyme